MKSATVSKVVVFFHFIYLLINLFLFKGLIIALLLHGNQSSPNLQRADGTQPRLNECINRGKGTPFHGQRAQ